MRGCWWLVKSRMTFRGVSLTFLLLTLTSTWIQLGSGAGEKCDPVSGVLLDPNNKPLPNSPRCGVGEYCHPVDPPTVPPTGDCGAQGGAGSHCSKNEGCLPGTTIEAKRFLCSIKPGAKEGICGCLLDYLTQAQKEDFKTLKGYMWEQDPAGMGCIKKVQPKRPCDPLTQDVCEDTSLVCRPENAKDGKDLCLFPFSGQDDGQDCYHESDCKRPRTCHIVNIKGTCGCPPGQKNDPKNATFCIQKYAGFLIKCDTDDDCLPEFNIECVTVQNTQSTVCSCKEASNQVFEYFPQRNSHDRCYRVYAYKEACQQNEVLTQVGFSHNCRRKSPRETVTNLICNQNNICDCEQGVDIHFFWDGKCSQKYAWYDEVCLTDSNKLHDHIPDPPHRFRCDSVLNLMCSEQFKCQCIPGAQLLVNKRKACKIRELTRGFDETCNNKTLLCNTDLHLTCTDGRCACVVDPAIAFDPKTKFCRFQNRRRRLSSSASLLQSTTITFLISTITLVQILKY